MDSFVVMLAFAGAIGLFAAWLALTLRSERSLRHAEGHQVLHRQAASRTATRRARRESVAPVPVVRPGTFCRVVGAYGRSSRGTIMVCSSRARGRPRWCQARLVEQTARVEAESLDAAQAPRQLAASS
jgi:hypothetical protein